MHLLTTKTKNKLFSHELPELTLLINSLEYPSEDPGGTSGTGPPKIYLHNHSLLSFFSLFLFPFLIIINKWPF